jgi:hypothetical protein
VILLYVVHAFPIDVRNILIFSKATLNIATREGGSSTFLLSKILIKIPSFLNLREGEEKIEVTNIVCVIISLVNL